MATKKLNTATLAGQEWLLELKGIQKRFGPVIANRNIDLKVKAGEVHALVGENGAGKSTLMKILYGLYKPDAGSLHYNGQELHHHSPQKAIELGIGMIHQHFMLIPTLTVAENVVLGEEPRKGFAVDRKLASAKVREISERFGLALDPDRKVSDLSVGEQQRVEIIKLLYRGAELLILDEPTADLTPGEVQAFFKVLRSLVTEGKKTVIIITHKLDEVMAISNRITVIRQGETINSLITAETQPSEIAREMVGREVSLVATRPVVKRGDVVLKVNDLSVKRPDGVMALENCSFEIHAGEVFGIAGVEGSGQRELIEALMGLHRQNISGGSISLLNQPIDHLSPMQRLDGGISHVPEDRHARGLVLDFSISDNLLLGQQHHFTQNGLLETAKIQEHAKTQIKKLDIRPPLPQVAARGLSGGNQQKIVIAREFFRNFHFLISAQPTRGVDIGAIEQIHALLLQARSEGKAILLLSAELSEILSLSDRIGVLYKGKLVKILPSEGTTAPELGNLMTGASQMTGAKS